MLLFIAITTGVALGILIGGYLCKRLILDPQFNRIEKYIDGVSFHMQTRLSELLETQYSLWHEKHQSEKLELDDAVRHSLQELVITLQTIKSYAELDDVKKQETLEWAITKSSERFAESNETTILLLREILSVLTKQANEPATPPVSPTPPVEKVKRVRKPRTTTTTAKTAKAEKAVKKTA